ncbi:hypothetical protein AB0883_12565 [Micromonospora sp. NPDC047812]|uniref:hypothetical protein n=1 Tax=Micromonospora sp. NPDC047812 TaxID=3155742 RepID=UPI003454C767
MLTAKFTTAWRAGDDVTRRSVEPFLRRELRLRAAAIASHYSVDQYSAAADEIQLAVGTLCLCHDHLGSVEATSMVRVTVDPSSRKLQEDRLYKHRDHQLRTEVEKVRAAALRDEVFGDLRTTLAWLLLRFPELSTAAPGELIRQMIKEAEQQHAESLVIDERQQVITDLVSWLTSGAEGPQAALKTLDFVLEPFGEDQLRQRLRMLNTLGPESVPIVRQGSVSVGTSERETQTRQVL